MLPFGARLRLALVALLTALLAAAGCGSSTSPDATRPGVVNAIATTTQVADFVRAVGGDKVQVVQLLQPNSDPHEYEPRPNDVRALADAPVVFESGDGLDDWMDEVVEASGADPRVVTLSQTNVARVSDDPHWWHDPHNVRAAIPAIRDALARVNPSAADVYAGNARAYLATVKRLDEGIAACVARVPPSQRKLVTDHDAFGHFARRYGIDVVGAVIPSQTTQAQSSAGDVAELSRTIRREHVRTVFPESSVSAKLARAIASETGADVGEELYGDTLGPAGSDGATYLEMERHNADAIVRGLTGGARGCQLA